MPERPSQGCNCQQELDERRERVTERVLDLFQAIGILSFADVVETTVGWFCQVASGREEARLQREQARVQALRQELDPNTRARLFAHRNQPETEPDPTSEPETTHNVTRNTHRRPRQGQAHPRRSRQPSHWGEHRGRHRTRRGDRQHQKDQPFAQEVRDQRGRGQPTRRQRRQSARPNLYDSPAYADTHPSIRSPPPPSYREAVDTQHLRSFSEPQQDDVGNTRDHINDSPDDSVVLLPEHVSEQDQRRQETLPLTRRL